MSKIIFNYHPETGEFVNASTADESPLEPGVYLIPANATEIPLPQIESHETAVFVDGQWQVKPDWRGVQLFKISDRSGIAIDEIGKTPADIDATDLVPTSPFDVFTNGSWVTDTAKQLADVQGKQIALIKAACASTITGGFQSSALGKAYIYPSSTTDQANLSANILSSIYPNLPKDWTVQQMCCDSQGRWDYVSHTAGQIQQVGMDWEAAKQACLTKNTQLQAKIKAATDIKAVEDIVW